MAVAARFYVSAITKRAANTGGIQLELLPVTRDRSNNDWSEYTPSGKIEMYISQGDAVKWFEDRLGKDIAITFEDRDSSEG